MPYTHDPALVVYGHAGGEVTTQHEAPERNFEIEITALPIPGLHHGFFSAWVDHPPPVL
jgi:hypothetical protein